MSTSLRSKRPSRGRRQERVEARVTPEQKQLLQRAAALRGRSLTDFIMSAAQEAAEAVIREHHVITLNAEESLAFAEALLEPPAPNAALREAATRYLASRDG